jgi:Flp pilus assembly protein CpaB
MERKVWIVSAAAALLGAALLQLHLRRLEQELSGGPRSRALVLARDLPARTTLTADMLGERELPRAYLESRHILARDLQLVIGARLGVAGRATEALLWTDLASVRDDARPLSSLVPESMRAFTLAVGADIGQGAGTSRSGARSSGLVTVSATLEQSLELAAAERAGSLRLLLRHPDDTGITADPAPAALSAVDSGERNAATSED